MERTLEKIQPLIKWVGGKTQLLPDLQLLVPESFGRYFEPFVGGGALFFSLQANDSVISDLNPRLINFYKQVANEPNAVTHHVTSIAKSFGSDSENNKSVFYSLRQQFNETESQGPVAAALFLILNKTAFNGLYRENGKGEFNVPFNHFGRVPNFFDDENLLKASALLSRATIKMRGFEGVLEDAESGDFVYFDPPYVPLTVTSSFTSYTSNEFGEVQQLKLLETAVALRENGVQVLLSNSYSDWVIENYSRAGFRVNSVSAQRNVAAKSSSRARVSEALISGFTQ